MHNNIQIDTSGLFTGIKSIFKELSGLGIKSVVARQSHTIPKVNADGKTENDIIEIEVEVTAKE